MKVFWQERRAGQRLILETDDGNEVEVGGVRSKAQGFDAFAKTNTYDPGRAQKGFESMEEAKSFVEFFHPWDLFGGDLDLEVEEEVRPLESADATVVKTEAEAPTPAPESPAASEEETAQPVASEKEEVPFVDQPPEEEEVPVVEQPTEAHQNAPVEESRDVSAGEAEKPQKRGWLFWRKG